MTGWTLSVDVGTTATAAAVGVDGERRPVELDGRSNMPSTVLAPESGPLVVGRAADSQAILEPDRVEHTPKRRLGDPVLLLGDRAVDPVDAVAAVLDHVRAAASATFAGTSPERLVLTHPARWGSARLDQLTEAAGRAHLPAPVLVPEPVAAAAHLAPDLAAPGDLLAVYDLGGGTFDAAIVRRSEDGFVVAGPPGGDDTIGGETLDDLVVQELRAGLEPAVADHLATSGERVWRQAGAGLRQSARSAKEALSTSETFAWYLGPPVDAEFSLGADRLESIVRGPVVATVHSLLDTIARSGLTPAQLRGVVMVGGCARAPLVGRLLTEATGREPLTWGDPKAAVSLGALLAADAAAPSTTDDVPPVAHEPRSVVTVAATALDPESATASEATLDRESGFASEPVTEREREMAPTETGAPAWDRARIGTFVAVLLVLLGVVSALLAYLLG